MIDVDIEEVQIEVTSSTTSSRIIKKKKGVFLTQFITPERELDKISAAECVLVFHEVKHGHSYRSQDCTVDLIRTIFESLSLAKSISCGDTKARAIACNVLGPYLTTIIIDDLLKARFYSLSGDASNKGSCKTFPLAVQYFSEIGVSRGLIEFINDSNETAVNIFNNICKVIDKYKFKLENLTSFGADNTNVNFGKNHSVFQLLKEKVSHLLKGNCYCHVLHNAVHTAHDDLPIDIETILCKLYSYFSRSAKRMENLKEYFDFVQVDFQAELQLQRSYTTAIDPHFIITHLLNKLQRKLSDKYYGNNTRLLLKQLKEIGETKCVELETAFDLFINKVIAYVKSYFDVNGSFYEKLSFFNAQSFNFRMWKNVIDITDFKNEKLSDKIKFYISSKTNDSYSWSINDQTVVCDDHDNEQMISPSNKEDEDFIRSDQLWAYLLNTNPNATLNWKKTDLLCLLHSMYKFLCRNNF
ncbi:unnamed protein product [Rotaria magnacalcarata]